MRLAQDDEMVNTLAPNRSDQPFGKAVLPRRGWCGRLVPDAHGAQSACHRPRGLSGLLGFVPDFVVLLARHPGPILLETCAQRETLTIAGFALDGSKWDGLFVGRRKGDDLVYAGKIDHGFDKVFKGG
jgi:hypothetical protein